LLPTYFSPITHYIALANADNIVFEVADNYQKQTYRTRCYIYSASGKQALTIPALHPLRHKKTKDIQIDYSFNWPKQHLKSIQIAYRSSPYFEFYEDEIVAIFDKKQKFLLDYNLQIQEVILELIQLDISFSKTAAYSNTDALDLRFLAEAKSKRIYNLDSYFQVFSDKHGFIEDLSILDLLFMEGTNTLNYLENQTLNLM